MLESWYDNNRRDGDNKNESEWRGRRYALDVPLHPMVAQGLSPDDIARNLKFLPARKIALNPFIS